MILVCDKYIHNRLAFVLKSHTQIILDDLIQLQYSF